MYKNLDFLKRWAEHYGSPETAKTAFIASPPGGAPPGGAPPMPPEMMGGMPPDPAAMGGMPPEMMGAMPPGGAPPGVAPPGVAPPMPPEMMGGDPATQAMADQEMTRSMIQQEVQKALGGGDAGLGVAGPKKSNSKEDMVMQMEQRIMKAIEQRDKMYLATLRQAGIEIPMADIMGIETAAQQPQQGLSETMTPGNSGTNDGSLVSKAAAYDEDIANIVELAKVRDSLKKSAMGRKLVDFDPLLPEKNYFQGLCR